MYLPGLEHTLLHITQNILIDASAIAITCSSKEGYASIRFFFPFYSKYVCGPPLLFFEITTYTRILFRQDSNGDNGVAVYKAT